MSPGLLCCRFKPFETEYHLVNEQHVTHAGNNTQDILIISNYLGVTRIKMVI